jgi:hypothetical protein
MGQPEIDSGTSEQKRRDLVATRRGRRLRHVVSGTANGQQIHAVKLTELV